VSARTEHQHNKWSTSFSKKKTKKALLLVGLISSKNSQNSLASNFRIRMTRKRDKRKEPIESHEIMQVKHEEYTHGEVGACVPQLISIITLWLLPNGISTLGFSTSPKLSIQYIETARADLKQFFRNAVSKDEFSYRIQEIISVLDVGVEVWKVYVDHPPPLEVYWVMLSKINE
jgi:hypothetical protein